MPNWFLVLIRLKMEYSREQGKSLPSISWDSVAVMINRMAGICRMTPANPPSFWRRNRKQKAFPRKSMSRNCSRTLMWLPRNTPRPLVFSTAAVLSACSRTKLSCLMRPSAWKTRTTIFACVRARNSTATTSSKSRRKSTTACISNSV